MMKYLLIHSSAIPFRRLTFLVVLGLFVGVTITISPIIDIFLESHLNLQLPNELERFPFKAISFFGFLILIMLSMFLFVKAKMPLFIKNKEKIIITSLLLSSQALALTGSKIEISDFVSITVLFLGLMYIFVNNDSKIILNPLYLLMLVLLFSTFLSVSNGSIRLFLVSSVVIKAFVAFFLIDNMIRDRKIAIFTIKIFLLLTTISAITGILQEIIYILTGVPLVGFVLPGIKKFMWEPTSYGMLLRIPAFTGWYVALAHYLTLAIIIGVNLLLYSVLKNNKEKIALYIAEILMIIALLLTFSNSSLLVVVLGILFSFFLRWQHLLVHFVVVILLALLLACLSGIATDFMDNPKSYIVSSDIQTRIQLFREGVTGFVNRHPIIGNGIGRGSRYTNNVYLWPAHNNILHLADELGSLGVITYIMFFCTVIYRYLSSIIKLQSKNDKNILIALLIALIVFMANKQFHPGYIDFLLFMYLGMIEGIRRVFLLDQNFIKAS